MGYDGFQLYSSIQTHVEEVEPVNPASRGLEQLLCELTGEKSQPAYNGHQNEP